MYFMTKTHKILYEEQENLMSPLECKDLITFCENNLEPKISHYITGHSNVDGGLQLKAQIDEKIMKAVLFEIPNDHPINQKLWESGVNWSSNNGSYNINSHTGTTVSKYEDGGHYGWHVDGFGKNDRLSATVQLSDPNDYEGCELQFGEDLSGDNRTTGQDIHHDWDLTQKSVKTVHTLSKNIGAGCIFDSFLYHRVTPCVKGIRYSLLTWYREYEDGVVEGR